MELDAFVHLLMKALAGSAVGWVKCGVVTIGASSSSHLSVAVGTCETGVQHDFLQTLTVFPLEIPYERVIPFPVREAVSFKYLHINKNSMKTFLP